MRRQNARNGVRYLARATVLNNCVRNRTFPAEHLARAPRPSERVSERDEYLAAPLRIGEGSLRPAGHELLRAEGRVWSEPTRFDEEGQDNKTTSFRGARSRRAS